MEDSRVMVREHIYFEWSFCLGIFKDLKTASKYCKKNDLENSIGTIRIINLQKWIKENEKE